MFTDKLKEIYSKLLLRKEKELLKNGYRILYPRFFETSVFLYMLINFDKYASGVLLNSHVGYAHCSEKKFELLTDFLNAYEQESHQDIRNLCKFYLAPVNLKEVFWSEYKYEKLSYFDLVQRLFEDKFLDDIDVFVSEFYSESENETQISKCASYSQKLPVPTNRNYEYWSRLKAQDFVHTALQDYYSYRGNYIDKKSEVEMFFYYVCYNFHNIYRKVYEKSDENNFCVGKQHYYDERRRFLSMFFGNYDRGIDILAYSFALPIKAFRSFLWKLNVDLQDLESYIRRMDSLQFTVLKNAYYLLCVDLVPELHPACKKGWKHIFHRPSLDEVKNEELYDESERFNKNWAVVKNEAGLDMGFTMYRGTEDDTVNSNSKYLSKKDHKNYKDQGFSEFYINPDGFYGIATRKIFGNYLWGDFEEQDVGGWVCPRFWTTFLLYFILLVVSPICCGFFFFGGIENIKILVWLGIFASILPILIIAYSLKFFISNVVKFFLGFVCDADEKIKELIDKSINVYDKLDNSKVWSKISYTILKIVWYSLLITIFSYAYEPVLAVSFAVIVDYFASSYLKKGEYIPLSNLKYAKYAIFLLVSVHLIFVWETLFDISKFFYELILNNYAYIISISMLIVPVYIVVGISNKYYEVQDKYVLGKANYDYSYVDSLFDKLIMVLVFAFFAIFIGEIIFFANLRGDALLKDGLIMISIFIGINVLLFSPCFFLFQRPVVLENEKSQYMQGKKLINGFVSNKMATFAVSKNKWLLDKADNFRSYYYLFDNFFTEHDKKFERLLVKYINRLDDGFLFEVRCLRTILKFRRVYYSTKHINKLINTNMTAREVVDYYDKLEAIQNKIFKKVEIIYDFFVYIFKAICYPFIWIWSIVCRFFGGIVDFYTFVVDTFHKMCPYSNASERI